jgi:hypothetical protein
VCAAIGSHGRSLCPGRKDGASKKGVNPENPDELTRLPLTPETHINTQSPSAGASGEAAELRAERQKALNPLEILQNE